MIAKPTDVRDPLFAEKLQLWDNQRKQDDANAKVKTEWLQAVDNWRRKAEQDQALGLPIDTAPALPKMTVWHDDGQEDHPPFPDLKVPVLSPPPVVVPAHGIKADKPPADRTDALLLMVQMLSDEIAAMAADLAAIRVNLKA